MPPAFPSSNGTTSKLNPVNDRKGMRIKITVKQAQQYNLMLHVLRKIHKEYMSPERMRKHPDVEFHGFEEYISMSYENIQEEARAASFKLQEIKIPTPTSTDSPS
jgi:hypothetical protein